MIFRHPSRQVRNESGFTLVEMLVVVAIFSIASLVVTNIFLLTTRSSQHAATSQKIQGDVRFAIEAMAREMRFGTIDYDCYGQTAICDPGGVSVDLDATRGKSPLLAIRDTDGNRIRYKMISVSGVPKLQVCFIDTDELSTKCNDISAWQVMTPEDVKIEEATFYLYPFVNPFKLRPNDQIPPPYDADAQPRATIVLKTKQTSNASSPEQISIQTSVVSRYYVR